MHLIYVSANSPHGKPREGEGKQKGMLHVQCTYANMLEEREGGRLDRKVNRSSIGSSALLKESGCGDIAFGNTFNKGNSW